MRHSQYNENGCLADVACFSNVNVALTSPALSPQLLCAAAAAAALSQFFARENALALSLVFLAKFSPT